MRTGITPAEAQQLVLEATPVLAPEWVPASEALGRVLAAAVSSTRDLPPADNSAMDGYAVRRADLLEARRDAPVSLRVVDEVVAGALADVPLVPGGAARILTGAPLPPGCDAVLRQEDVEREGEVIRVAAPPEPRENIRDSGEDVRAGERVMEAGSRIGAPQLGMLAALGRSVVSVHQRPRVAILSGGDELVEPDGDVSGGRIVSSNSYSLAAQCREVGALPIYLGIARDSPEDLERHFRAGLRADLLVSSAGVSVGDRDYVRGVLEKLGCSLVFWGVEMKPGYPVAFGRFAGDAGPLVFGLPGNPVSAVVTFEQFVRPALLKLAGRARWFRPLVRARLGEGLEKKAGRLHFVRVELERRGGEIVALTTGSQGSGVLSSMLRAQGLLVFPADATRLAEGEEVGVQLLEEDFFDSTHAGF